MGVIVDAYSHPFFGYFVLIMLLGAFWIAVRSHSDE